MPPSPAGRGFLHHGGSLPGGQSGAGACDAVDTHHDLSSLGHAAAVIDSDDALLATALPFLEDGFRAGDRTLLSCRERTADLVRSALGPRGATIENDPRLRMAGVRAPDALVVTFRHLDRVEDSGRLRLLGEVDFGAAPRDWREAERYESAANAVLAEAPVTVLCLYDRRVLSDQAVASAHLTHPELVVGGRRTANDRFCPPEVHLRVLPVPREGVEAGPPVLAVDDAVSLAGLRRQLGLALRTLVRDPEQAEDLHLAVSEIASNAFRHGMRPVSARVWADDEHVVCTVTDRGHTFDDPLAGFRPAHGTDLGRGGMGLWLARKLWDSVDLIAGAEGLTVRLATRLG